MDGDKLEHLDKGVFYPDAYNYDNVFVPNLYFDYMYDRNLLRQEEEYYYKLSSKNLHDMYTPYKD